MGFVVVFLLGATPYQEVQRKASAEHDIHGDVVQVDIVDSYENVTYKSVMLLRWAREKCSNTDFVLKIDDDVLLSVWDLAVVANSLGGIKRSMWGYLYCGFRPHRNVASKLYVFRDKYGPDTYPDFLSGTGYLISSDAISALEDVTHDECFFTLEDIYMTGIVAERAQADLPLVPTATPAAAASSCSSQGNPAAKEVPSTSGPIYERPIGPIGVNHASFVPL
nr:beta-1,3-galactosyltransferase 5-like [Rhipicephalus microplus]